MNTVGHMQAGVEGRHREAAVGGNPLHRELLVPEGGQWVEHMVTETLSYRFVCWWGFVLADLGVVLVK